MNRVVTLSESQFPEACRKLAEDVIRSGFEFDILVGIASGGWYVARHMPAPVRLSVTLRRASTATKKKLLPSLLKYLPRSVCDMLRIAESRFYGLLSHLRKPHVSSIDLSDEVLDTLRSRPDARILIVDDAVDSGSTLLTVRESIAGELPKAEIRTAVITQTRRDPLIRPDYKLFPTGTIVRFPWAPDA